MVGDSVFVIAEAGVNHNGDRDRAGAAQGCTGAEGFRDVRCPARRTRRKGCRGDGRRSARLGMGALTTAVLPQWMRKRLDGHLPEYLDVKWWRDEDELVELAPQAQIGWFDLHVKAAALEAIGRAERLRWLSSAYAGVDWMPLEELHERGVVLSCGAGLAANQVAEFAVMSMLAAARGYREIVRAQDRHDWLPKPPAMRELANQSTRTAIAIHAKRSRLTDSKIKLLWIAGGLSASLASLMVLPSFPTIGTVGLVLGLIISGYFGWQTIVLRAKLPGPLTQYPGGDTAESESSS